MSYQLSKEELRAGKISKEEFKRVNRNPIYIILDSLKCAHNIGTILRLSDSLLIKKVYICGNTIVPPNKKIKTSSRGAERWVEFEYVENILDVVKKLKDEGVEITSVEVANDSINYTEYSPKFPIALIFGREFDGVNKDVLNNSNKIVHLPLLGMANSINVSTAASVVMYDVYNKLITNKTQNENN